MEPDQHVYIDTAYVQPYVWPDNHSPDEVGLSRDVVGSLSSSLSKNPTMEVVVPQVVIRELVNNLIRDGVSDDLERFPFEFDKLLEKLDIIDFESVPTAAFEAAKEVNSRDSRITGNDALIAGCALVDPDSSRLVTTDEDLLETQAISEMSAERLRDDARNRKLKVQESF